MNRLQSQLDTATRHLEALCVPSEADSSQYALTHRLLDQTQFDEQSVSQSLRAAVQKMHDRIAYLKLEMQKPIEVRPLDLETKSERVMSSRLRLSSVRYHDFVLVKGPEEIRLATCARRLVQFIDDLEPHLQITLPTEISGISTELANTSKPERAVLHSHFMKLDEFLVKILWLKNLEAISTFHEAGATIETAV